MCGIAPMAVPFVVVDHAIGIASDKVLVVFGEFDASYSGIVGPEFTNKMLSRLILQIKDLD